MNRRARVIALFSIAVIDFGLSTTGAGSPPAQGDHAPPAATGATARPAHGPASAPIPSTPAPGTVKYAPAAGTAGTHAPAGQGETPTADEVLKLLREGNERWVRNSPTSPHTDLSRREQVTTNGQTPMVTILTCADSRLPVERMFDRGVGDVFVVRVAGNVVGTELTGTVEYGLGHLHTPVLIVMGHTKCGAVAAAASGAEVHGSVRAIIHDIQPAVERARRQNAGADKDTLLTAAIRENVWQSVYDLFKSSDEVRSMAAKGQVRVVGAVADIATGKVEFLGEHPWQAELISSLDAAAKALDVGAHAGAPEAPHDAHGKGH